MMPTVQLSITDASYAAAIRKALTRTGRGTWKWWTIPMWPSYACWFWMSPRLSGSRSL
jgi:hypothetical protein